MEQHLYHALYSQPPAQQPPPQHTPPSNGHPSTYPQQQQYQLPGQPLPPHFYPPPPFPPAQMASTPGPPQPPPGWQHQPQHQPMLPSPHNYQPKRPYPTPESAGAPSYSPPIPQQHGFDPPKKRRLDHSPSTPVPQPRNSQSNGTFVVPPLPSPTPKPKQDTVPIVPLLYHTAVKAHQDAQYHLRQAFVPAHVQPPLKGASWSSLPLETPNGDTTFMHDPRAASTAMRMLVMALDLLRAGLGMSGLSDMEKAAFGLEFVNVGIKVLTASSQVRSMRKEDRVAYGPQVDHERLREDVDDTAATSLAIAQKSPHMKVYRHGLELASARLAFLKDKGNQGKRVIKQALAATTKDEFLHRYNLQFLLLHHLDDMSSGDFFTVAADVENEARGWNHIQILQLLGVARVKALYKQRKWDRLRAGLGECGQALQWSDDPNQPQPPAANKDEEALRAALTAQFLLLQSLCDGRYANDNAAKLHLKNLYALIDQAAETNLFNKLRASGGLAKLPLAGPNGQVQYLYVQTTPINALYTLVYLTTVVARRDYQGADKTCRTLMHVRALREWEGLARSDEFWDSGFTPLHGLADAIKLRHMMMTLLAEGMMEEALALICRSAFVEAEALLVKLKTHLIGSNLFTEHFPQLALLHAQFYHALGNSDKAIRYYKAAQSTIVPGSELRIAVDIGLMGAEGGLENLSDQTNERRTQAIMLADTCRSGTNAALHAVGHFISSLTESERSAAKRKLSAAYEIVRKSNQNMLHVLIFAFTTGNHLYGDFERQTRQLEAGHRLAQMLGGKDRTDGVGQPVLGLWYSVKLREQYRLAGRTDEEEKANRSVVLHLQRLEEMKKFASR